MPQDTEASFVAQMGEILGIEFSALWQEVAWLYVKWAQFVELFGDKPERIDMLNSAARVFFRVVQDTLWEDTLLHIARLTDPAESPGGKKRTNLTIQNLSNLVSDPILKDDVRKLSEIASTKSKFCRDWRNRHIAHRDRALALGRSATPLEPASRKSVNDAMAAIADVLKKVGGHYMNSDFIFRGDHFVGGARDLLYIIDDGLKTGAA